MSELDALAKSTGTHNIFGYYDVCAIEMALQGKGYELRWFDPRKPIEELDLSSPDVVGVLINIAQTTLFFFTTRHWLGVRKVPIDSDEEYDLYWMDSKDKRERKMDIQHVKAQIDALRTSKNAQVIYLARKPFDQEADLNKAEPQS